MTDETEHLYTLKKNTDNKDEPTRSRELKTALVLFETDEGKIVTYDEFLGKKPIEVEAVDDTPATDAPEPEVENPALYPLYKSINTIEETKDELGGYTQVIVKFTDEVNNDARA